MSGKLEVVIVGGSSGAVLASQLSAARAQFDPAKYNLTLVTQLPYNVWLVATARMTVTTSTPALDSTDQAFIPYDNLFAPGNAGRVIQGKAVEITENPNTVVLENGQSLRYDYLVLATGSKWTGPSAFDKYTSAREVEGHVQAWREKVQKSNSIVIVGGGAVGIELAGEIKTAYPTKSVTLIHAHSLPLNAAYPDKFRQAVVNRFEKAGVKLILGEKVLDLPEEGAGGEGKDRVTFQTTGGRSVQADLFIPALGPKPNTSYLASFRSGSALTPSGHVRVAPSLNISFGSSTSPNIFALGDIIDWNEQSMIGKTNGQIAVVKQNLLAALAGQVGKGVYKGGMEAIFLPLGPNGGIGYLPFLWGIIVGDWIVSTIKSKGLFVSFSRKGYGLK